MRRSSWPFLRPSRVRWERSTVSSSWWTRSPAAPPTAPSVEFAFGLLVALIAADNLLWRVASWIGIKTFVGVTGDVRRDLFRHLTGHAPSYFVDRLPGTLTSRITATANAMFTVENMLVWNVVPPCLSTLLAIALVFTVSGPMAALLLAVACLLVIGMFRRAAAGAPHHHAFADKAAAVDGEMIDVVGNMALVCAFGGLKREHARFDESVDREMRARRSSLVYLEKLRLAHAVTTVVLTIGLLAWAIMLWQAGSGHDRGGRANLHARYVRAACDARSRGCTRRCYPAYGPSFGGARYPAGSARTARAPRSSVAVGAKARASKSRK